MHGIEIFLQTFLENSISGSWELLEYPWNFIYKIQHEPWLWVTKAKRAAWPSGLGAGLEIHWSRVHVPLWPAGLILGCPWFNSSTAQLVSQWGSLIKYRFFDSPCETLKKLLQTDTIIIKTVLSWRLFSKFAGRIIQNSYSFVYTVQSETLITTRT